jgi:hypothetical protein
LKITPPPVKSKRNSQYKDACGDTFAEIMTIAAEVILLTASIAAMLTCEQMRA